MIRGMTLLRLMLLAAPALGCEGVRKSVAFELAAGPFAVQFSGVPADEIGMVLSPR